MHTRVSSVWIYAGEAPAPATPEPKPATSEPAADAGAPKETDAAADARGRLVASCCLAKKICSFTIRCISINCNSHTHTHTHTHPPALLEKLRMRSPAERMAESV